MIGIDDIKYRVEEIAKYSKNYIDEQKLDKLNDLIDVKIKNFKPSLMVYGTYNAGKSTLLNALFGKDEMAKTGDAPETFKVTEYKYNGYTLYDTPGINAPIEHEKITEEHLKKSELILFVLSNDGSFEERFIYERIINVIRLNKPILIVLNNKKGTKKNSQEEIEQLEKVNENLIKIAKEFDIVNIEEKVDIVIVNAKTALKAKLENKPILLNRSNILQLEQKIDQLLLKSSSKDVINTLAININNFIDEVIANINSKIDDIGLRKIEELKTELEKLKKSVSIELKNTIKQDEKNIANELKGLLLEQNKEAIDSYTQKVIDDTSNYTNRKLENIRDELKIKVDNFNNEIKKIDIKKDNLKINDIDITPNNITSNNSDSIEDTIGKILPVIISSLPIKIPAAIITIATTLFSIFSGSSKEKDMAEAKLEEEKKRQMLAKNKADSFAYEFKKSFELAIDESLNNLFNDTLLELNRLSSDFSSDSKKVEEAKKKLNSLRINV